MNKRDAKTTTGRTGPTGPRRFNSGLVAVSLATLLSVNAEAGSGVSIEAVDTYTNCQPLQNNQTNATNFRNISKRCTRPRLTGKLALQASVRVKRGQSAR